MIKTILIVDDSKSILDILEHEINSQLNVRILRAMNFKEALKFILQEEVIHIAILDLNLPDAPKGEIVDYAIKKAIPSVVLTGTISEQLKQVILKKDIVDYIIKDSPTSIRNVVNIIDRTLRNYDTNVLVVEDSPIQLKLVKAQLEKLKLNVDTATNGQEALDLFMQNKDKYSLVLTDYNMPIMDGLELTFKLRDMYKKDKLAIVVFSANNTPEVATNFIKLGANDFISKPYKEVEFNTRINSNLELIDMFRDIRQKDKQLFEASKNTQMSEMIGNIAHHWRQPLNEISVTASGISLNHEMGILEDNETIDGMEVIVARTKFLSDTIDKFAKFINDDSTEAKITIMQDKIDDVLQVLSATFDDEEIDISKDICDNEVSINIVDKDLTHALITILENAVDILVEKNIKNKKINIVLSSTINKIVLSIEDNAGGIPEEFITKIFDPYFTTKHQAEGTGMDLNIAFNMLSGIGGKLYVENTNLGAKFFIELPLDN